MEEIYEIFGMKLRVVADDGGSCDGCALIKNCGYSVICRDAQGNHRRKFIECTDKQKKDVKVAYISLFFCIFALYIDTKSNIAN